MKGSRCKVRMHTHKKILRIGWIAADAEELHKIVELAVDVATYLGLYRISLRIRAGYAKVHPTYRHGGRHGNDIALFDEELPCLVAYFANLGFGDRPASAKLRDGSNSVRQCNS